MTLPVPMPRPSYSQARENLVKAIPPKIICLLACGGRDCRYEGPACWRPSQQAVRGIFSTWVTDDIIAMARPSTHLIKRYSIIEQFQRLNIKSIINMQLPGEHAHCGPPLEPDSGFTYSPQVFMENDIFFYNFGMPDFGVSSQMGILDGVKVLAFAVKEGKVAVHCHAGLGRTGVLIACYLIYTLRVSPSEAIHYVRIKRPRSIQTRAQIDLVFDFARLLAPQLIQYPTVSRRHGFPFSLQQYLQRQNLLLHGAEARALRDLPKVMHFLCGRLTALALGRTLCPGAQAELERRAAILDLTAEVRETLVAKKVFLRVLNDQMNNRKASLDSSSSWDDPEGFLVRKREVLLNKRSYSDSDLSKITLFQDLDVPYPIPAEEFSKDMGPDVPGNEQKPTDPAQAALKMEQCNGSSRTRGGPGPALRGINTRNFGKKTKCTAKKTTAFPKFRSDAEFRRSLRSTRPVLASQAVAKAMAQQEPTGKDVLHRAALLQDELNENEYAWAILATESDPAVIATLLWTWLEKLKEPVLKAEDIGRLISASQGINGLGNLQKAQEQTVSCVLRCVGQVTSLCPQLEEAVVCRAVQALTRRLQDDSRHCTALMKAFEAIVKGFRCHDSGTRAVSKATKAKKNK